MLLTSSRYHVPFPPATLADSLPSQMSALNRQLLSQLHTVQNVGDRRAPKPHLTGRKPREAQGVYMLRVRVHHSTDGTSSSFHDNKAEH